MKQSTLRQVEVQSEIYTDNIIEKLEAIKAAVLSRAQNGRNWHWGHVGDLQHVDANLEQIAKFLRIDA